MSFVQIIRKCKKITQSEFDQLMDKYGKQYYYPSADCKQELTDDQFDLLEGIYTERFGERKKIGVSPPDDMKNEGSEGSESDSSTSSVDSQGKPKKRALPKFLTNIKNLKIKNNLAEIKKDRKKILKARKNSSDSDTSSSTVVTSATVQSMVEDEDHDEKLPTKQTLEKVLLHRYMGGLNKIKTERELTTWTSKNEADSYLIFDKLDGVAAELEQINGVMTLHKRGDETHGTDISTLIPFFKFPKMPKNAGIRGELVMPVEIFKSKYAEEMNDPRSMVAGLTNSKTLDQSDRLKEIKFIVYQLYPTKGEKALCKSAQIATLKKWGYNVCHHTVVDSDELNEEMLTEYIKDRKTKAICELDGAVLVNDIEEPLLVKDNPKHMVAFKIAGDTALALVLDIVWKVKKHGFFKPKVIIEPTKVCGVTIKSITGHNAKNIVDNRIAPGAQVLITRSNDVIPYIKDVPFPADELKMPDEPYEWNESKVEIRIAKGSENDSQNISRIVAFFKAFEAKYLAEKTVAKLYEAGYTTIRDFLKLDEDDIMKLDGFKLTSSRRLVTSIQDAITDAPLYKVMAASGVGGIGLGKRKYKKVTDQYPGILDMLKDESRDEIENRIKKLGGFVKTLDQMVDSLYEFSKWLNAHPEITIGEDEDGPVSADSLDESSDDGEKKEETGKKFTTPERKPVDPEKMLRAPKKKTSVLLEKNIVFTGTRDSLIERKISSLGGIIKTGVSKTTNFLIVKDIESNTVKMQKAREYGATIITIEDFIAKYL